jgi:hypothetical protein
MSIYRRKLILGVNASIDHIKPVSRYADLALKLDNMEWVSFRVNLAKSDLTPEEFLSLIKAIATHRIGLS